MKRSLLLCLWLLAIYAKGQHSFTLSHLSVDEGLAHNNIYALYQDHEEYIWIGAGPNLHRYDGNQLVTYKHKIDDPNSLPGGDVRSIYQDRKGNLWIGSNSGGLSLFKDGIFKRIDFGDDQVPLKTSVEQIIEMPDSSLYLATWGDGIIIFKDGASEKIQHYSNDVNSLSSNNVVDLFYDEESERLWIGTWGWRFVLHGE